MGNSKSNKIYEAVLFLMLFSCIRPAFFSQFYLIKYTYTLISFIVIFLCIVLFVKKNKSFVFARKISLYFLILLIPTILYNLSVGNLIFYTKTYLSIWAIVVLIEYALINKKRKQMLETLGALIAMLTITNVIFILIFGANYLGNRSSFLGYDNTVLPFILFGSMISFAAPYIESKKNKKLKVLSITNVVAILINCFIVESSNAKIAAVFFIGLIILDRFKIINKPSFSKIMNLRTYIVFSIAAFLLIVVFRMQYLFEDIIVNDLHRNLSITGRTEIWDSVFKMIRERPLIGIGVEDFSERLMSDSSIFHAHSTYLNVMLECGIVGLFAYLNIFRSLWKDIKKQKSCRAVAVLSFCVLIYFVITIIEYYQYPHTFFGLITILYYVGNGAKKCSMENEK